MLYTLIIIIILIVCVFLMMVVLVQNSKGGGLASNFAGSNQVMGVRRTADFLEKASWTLAALLLVLSILASWAIEKPQEQNQTRIEKQIDNGLPLPSSPANTPKNFGTK